MKNLIYLLSIALLINFPLLAEEAKRELPKSGTLATSGSPSFNGPSDGPWGGLDLEGENPNPLLASVQQVSDNEFSYTITNNSEDQFSTTLRLVSYDLKGNRVKSSPASVSLRAGKSVTRTIRVGPNVNSLQVEMASFKRKEKKPNSAELTEEIKEKKAELQRLESELRANKKK